MKLFVWDFHGTLETGTEKPVTNITNEVLKKFGYERRMSTEECEMLWGKKWVDYFRFLLPKEPEQRVLELQQECFNLSDARFEKYKNSVRPTPHAKEVLDAVARLHQQILVSNTRKTKIRYFLDVVGLGEYFPDGKTIAIGAHENSGETKPGALRKFLGGKNFDKVVVVGDRPEDVRMAGAAADTGMPAVSYLYAHPHRKFLDCTPDYKIRDLREVLREI